MYVWDEYSGGFKALLPPGSWDVVSRRQSIYIYICMNQGVYIHRERARARGRRRQSS